MADDSAPKPGKGSRILDGLRDAVAGNFAVVTIEGETWVKQGHETPAHQLMETRKHLADLQLENDCLRSRIAALEEVLLMLAFDCKQVDCLSGDPTKWPTTIAYIALGGRIEGGVRIDTRSALEGKQNAPTASHRGEEA